MNSELINRCYHAGMENGWASGRCAKEDGNFIVEEDRLNKNSITIVKNKETLIKWFKTGNLCLGTGFIYKNLFFLQQINGGDEWAVYKITEKDVKQFESCSFGRFTNKELNDFLKEHVWYLTGQGGD